jgi:hypothetical protein
VPSRPAVLTETALPLLLSCWLSNSTQPVPGHLQQSLLLLLLLLLLQAAEVAAASSRGSCC